MSDSRARIQYALMLSETAQDAPEDMRESQIQRAQVYLLAAIHEKLEDLNQVIEKEVFDLWEAVNEVTKSVDEVARSVARVQRAVEQRPHAAWTSPDDIAEGVRRSKGWRP